MRAIKVPFSQADGRPLSLPSFPPFLFSSPFFIAAWQLQGEDKVGEETIEKPGYRTGEAPVPGAAFPLSFSSPFP